MATSSQHRESSESDIDSGNDIEMNNNNNTKSRPKRAAAIKARKNLRKLLKKEKRKNKKEENLNENDNNNNSNDNDNENENEMKQSIDYNKVLCRFYLKKVWESGEVEYFIEYVSPAPQIGIYNMAKRVVKKLNYMKEVVYGKYNEPPPFPKYVLKGVRDADNYVDRTLEILNEEFEHPFKFEWGWTHLDYCDKIE